MSNNGRNSDATSGVGGWAYPEQEQYSWLPYGTSSSTLPAGTVNPIDLGVNNIQAYGQPPSSTFRYPSPPNLTANATPYYYQQPHTSQSQHETGHASYANAARSSTQLVYNIRQPNPHYRSTPPASTPQSQFAEQARATAQWQLQQDFVRSSPQPGPFRQLPKTPSWAEVAAEPVNRPNPAYSTSMVYVGNPNLAASRQQFQNATGLQPNPTRNIDMRRQTPSPFPPPSILIPVNNANVGPLCDFDLFEDPVMDWLQVPRAIGERTGLVVNTSAAKVQSQGTRSPTGSIAPSSTGSSTRRSKREIMSGLSDYLCGQCRAGFHTPEDRRKHEIRVHSHYASRPYACSCGKRFLYPKDLRRHMGTHNATPNFFCSFPGCEYATTGFFRKDHCDRHIANHYRVDSAMQSSRSGSSKARSQR